MPTRKTFARASIARFSGACLAFLLADGAVAAPVTIGFDDMATGVYRANFVSQGITFSPSCHYDISNLTGSAVISNWMGFDLGGCFDGNVNHDYLGPAGIGGGGNLYVAPAAGRAFSLTSFEFVTISPGSGGYTLYSAAGGLANFSWSGGNQVEYNFSGPAWTNIDWLVFSSVSSQPVGFDNLTLAVHQVDEPSSLVLLGLTLFGLTRLRRRAPKALRQVV